MTKSIVDQFKYTEHERKPIIRIKWCLPQLKLLHAKLKKQMIYIGLPGIEALDIKAWIEYLNKVIAFQCSEYKEGTTMKPIDVTQLDKLLDDFERGGKLKTSIVYQGFMEDIVMGGLSERGQTFSQDDFLKIYNLDFCNNITTPRTIRNETGKIIYHYKLEAIDKLLQYQQKNGNEEKGSRFIMYLTVNSNVFNGDLSAIKDKIFTSYFKKIKTITRPEVVATRHMKAYCFYEINNLFHKYNFNVEFLPPIFYLGSSYPNRNNGSHKEFHRMMTFTILGTKLENGEILYKQDYEAFLNSKFVFATDRDLRCYTDRYIDETNFDPNPNELLSQSYTYNTLW